MSNNNNYTEMARGLCRQLVEQHFPGEAQMFDPIWEAFWQSLPGDRIEMLKEPPVWSGGRSKGALAALGDTSQQAMDALFVVGSVVGALVTLLNQDQDALIVTADIDQALRHHASQLGAPEHVRAILEKVGTPLLADQLAAVDWGQQRDVAGPASGLFRVDYCEPKWDGRGARHSISNTHTSQETDDLYRKRASEFRLFVDEQEWNLFAAGTEVQLSSLQPRHRRFLFVLLRSLARVGVITYAQVLKDVLQNPDGTGESVRSIKHTLNKKLGGVLDEFLTVQKTEERYEVTRHPYCWIRLDAVPSRLAPDLPA